MQLFLAVQHHGGYDIGNKSEQEVQSSWAAIRDAVGCESGKARGSTVRMKYERFLQFIDNRYGVARGWSFPESPTKYRVAAHYCG